MKKMELNGFLGFRFWYWLVALACYFVGKKYNNLGLYSVFLGCEVNMSSASGMSVVSLYSSVIYIPVPVRLMAQCFS
jgi:hypothetical protein